MLQMSSGKWEHWRGAGIGMSEYAWKEEPRNVSRRTPLFSFNVGRKRGMFSSAGV
jgi:hypothetical protein